MGLRSLMGADALRDVAQALELLLDVLVALGVFEVLQLALDDVGHELPLTETVLPLAFLA
jgi:hypothetical protein